MAGPKAKTDLVGPSDKKGRWHNHTTTQYTSQGVPTEGIHYHVEHRPNCDGVNGNEVMADSGCRPGLSLGSVNSFM